MNKSRLTNVCLLATGVFLLAITVHADTWTDSDTGYTWTYRINGETAEITTGSWASPAISPDPTGAVTIPSTLGGKPVTSIGEGAFYGCGGLTSVTIGNSVTSIGECAFWWCTGLRMMFAPERLSGQLHGPYTFNGRLPNDIEIFCYSEYAKMLQEQLTAADSSDTNIVFVTTNACRVTFDWKCSCEPIRKGRMHDYLSFSVDGVQQDAICGEVDWTTLTFFVEGDGEHVLRWTYQKDASGSEGEDCGWVRLVTVVPRVTLSFLPGDATAGVPPDAMSFYADDGTVPLPGCGTLSWPKHTFLGWNNGTTIFAAGAGYPCDSEVTALTAAWARNELAAPIIDAPEEFYGDTVTVSISAEPGTTIYYTLDGSEPSSNGTGCRPYQGQFVVDETTTIRAIAVRDDYFDSQEATFTVTKDSTTFGDAVNCPALEFSTDAESGWRRVKGESPDGYALRSGAISHNATSRLDTVVVGEGAITFSCKVAGEVIKGEVYDGLVFLIDGVQQGDLMGNADWTTNTFEVAGDGVHTLSWCYVKDESDEEVMPGDCAWLDEVVWAPAQAVAITLDANGGTLGDADAVRLYAEGEVVGELPQPTREGYGFVGWMYYGEIVTPDTLVTTPTNCSFVARWTANGYSIAYNPNGGSGTTSATAATYDSEATIAANGFTWAGHVFAGWATNATGEVVYAVGQPVTNLTAQSSGVVTLYAVWEDIPNEVVVSAEDGYLESEGDAFISLGHCAGPNTKIEVDLQITMPTNEITFKEIPFGSWGNSSDSTLFECYISYGNATTKTPQFSWEYSTTSDVRKAYNCDVVDQERHVISFDATTRTYKSGDYTYVFSDPILDITSTIPMSIFGRCSSKYATTTAHFGGATKMKVYGVKIWESGTLVKNFVPCLSSGIPGLRDLVNNLFVTGIDPSKVKYGGNIMEKDDAHLDLENVMNTSTPGENHYFNLPYTFKPTSRIEVDYALLAQGFDSSPFVFSVDGPSNGPWMQIWAISGHYAFTLAGQQRYTTANGVGDIGYMSVGTEYGVRRTVAMNSNSVWFVTAGYTNAMQTASPALTTSDNYRIIVGNRGNDLGRWMPMRLYGIKVYENNDMVKNYVPIVTNGVPCLIDTVGGVVAYPITQSGNSNTKSLVVKAGGEFDGHTAASEKEAYLEFSGTQSLDLGYSLTPNSCLEADFSMWDSYKNGTSNQELIRQENGSSGTYMRLAAVGANAYTDLWWQYSDGAKSTIESSVKNSNDRRQYIFDSYHSKTTFKCGGNVLYDVTMPETRTSTTGSGSLKLGLSNAYMRLYGLKISELGTPVRNYVPCLTNGVAGLYERYTKTFYPLTGGKVSGKGYSGQSSEFETVPQPATLTHDVGGNTVTLTCLAAGAQFYKWYADGVEIDGETGDSLTVEWTHDSPNVCIYSVKPVYTVFNETVIGEAVAARVEFVSVGGNVAVIVDMGGGKSVMVPQTWFDSHAEALAEHGGDRDAYANSRAANGRMSVAECYVVGLDPEIATNDFTITSFPMKADGTPDLDAILSNIDPQQSKWNVSGARPVLKGAASLDEKNWATVTEQNKSSFRFFKVEVELP